MNVLLIEDTDSIVKGLTYSFEKEGYDLVSKKNKKEANEYIRNHPKIDIILLDVTLPDGNGFDLYEEEIQERKIPTIFLTAKDDESSIVKGLNIGAEDYITKPFSTKELIARVNRILLRNNKSELVHIKDIEYDIDKMILKKDGEVVELTSLELKLVHLLFTNKNKVVSRETILEKIWERTGNDVDDHTVTVYFKRIREKIKTDIIKTIKGIGYRVDEE